MVRQRPHLRTSKKGEKFVAGRGGKKMLHFTLQGRPITVLHQVFFLSPDHPREGVGATFSANLEGKWVGGLGLENNNIIDLNIKSEARKLGIGSLLVDLALDFIEKEGFKKATISIGGDPSPAAVSRFIEKKGFRNIEIYDWGGEAYSVRGERRMDP